MLKRRIGYYFLILFFLAAMYGCPGGGASTVNPITVMSPIVATYEGTAVALNVWKAYIKGQEFGGSLKPAELDSRIAEFERARLAHRTAGDLLLASISAPTSAESQLNLQRYNDLMIQIAFAIGQAQVPATIKKQMTTQMQGGIK